MYSQLLTKKILAKSNLNFDKKGICINSTFLTTKPNIINSVDCLTACKNYDGCNYVTFRPDIYSLCLLFQTCSELDINSCPTCLTGTLPKFKPKPTADIQVL